MEMTKILPMPGSLILAYHRFVAASDGQLQHFYGPDCVADTLLATVPPEGWKSYQESWPECAPVIASLRRDPAARIEVDQDPLPA